MKDEKFNVSDPVIILFDDGSEQLGFVVEVFDYKCSVNRESGSYNHTFHKKQLAKASQLDIHRIQRQITNKENKRLKDVISRLERHVESKNEEMEKLKEIILQNAMKGIE